MNQPFSSVYIEQLIADEAMREALGYFKPTPFGESAETEETEEEDA